MTKYLVTVSSLKGYPQEETTEKVVKKCNSKEEAELAVHELLDGRIPIGDINIYPLAENRDMFKPTILL